jgi:hypothetical protein
VPTVIIFACPANCNRCDSCTLRRDRDARCVFNCVAYTSASLFVK